MYAAGLVSPSADLHSRSLLLWTTAGLKALCSSVCLQGMLEPTKEPVKPVSAAEMIASIAQAPLVASEKSSCSTDTVQVRPQDFYESNKTHLLLKGQDWDSSFLWSPRPQEALKANS